MMKARQDGFTIVEILVSIVLLGIIFTGLAGLTYTTARQAVVNTDATTLQAVSLETVNRLTALPYNALTGATGCAVVGSTNKRFQRCVTVNTVGNSRQVQVVTTALDRSKVPPSTVTFTRVAPPSGNPLCLGC